MLRHPQVMRRRAGTATTTTSTVSGVAERCRSMAVAEGEDAVGGGGD
jgi:hypothetical protein